MVKVGEIAVAKSGHFFIARAGDDIQIGDIRARRLTTLPALAGADVIAFAADGEGLFALFFGIASPVWSATPSITTR